MSNAQKSIIWNLLEKYEGSSLANSLSLILQGKSNEKDYLNVVSFYNSINQTEASDINSCLGDEIMIALND